jgi:phospholipid transport system substrate-binding protein
MNIRKWMAFVMILLTSLSLWGQVNPTSQAWLANNNNTNKSSMNKSISKKYGFNAKNNPFILLDEVADKTFKRFKQEKKVIEGNPNHIKKIIREEMLPYIDNKYASYKVLGRYLSKTSKLQRTEFVKWFTEYMVTNYAQIFASYKDQDVKVEAAKKVTDAKVVSINVKIIDPVRPPINIQFKARKTKKKQWKFYDLVAENISVLVSKQAEINQLIRKEKGNLDSVISLLKEKSMMPINLKKR